MALPVFSALALAILLMWPDGNIARATAALSYFLVTLYGLIRSVRLGQSLKPPAAFWLVVAVPLIALIQLYAGLPAYRLAAREQLIQWMTFTCAVWLGAQVAKTGHSLQFLRLLSAFAALIAALAIAHYFTAGGQFYWKFPSAYQHVYGPFVYYNNYASFMVLCLPVTLWLAVHDRRHWWLYALAAAIMYGTVVGFGSRAGAALVTFAALWVLMRSRRPGTVAPWFPLPRRAWLALLLVAFALTMGVDRLIARYLNPEPFAVRKELWMATWEMVKARPLTAWGLGNWVTVYPAFAVKDFGVLANHAHSEWLQWWAEGGLLLVLLMLAVAALALTKSLSFPWGIGAFAVFLHALVDYPFIRPALGAAIFVLIGLLSAQNQASTHQIEGSSKLLRPASHRP